MQRTTLDKALRIAVALPTLVLLAYSSFTGFVLGVIFGDDDIISQAWIFLLCSGSGVVGSFVMVWAGKKRFHFWMILFPAAGILSGLTWSYFSQTSEGELLLATCFIFIFMYFLASWRSRIKG
jgi:hypothetical protein